MAEHIMSWGNDRPIRTFEARYPGHCEECGDPFERDDSVLYDDQGRLLIDHGCAEAGTGVFPPVKGCPKCFLVHGKGQAECD